MTKFLRAGIALAVVGVLGWLVACSDHPGGPNIEPQVADSLIVSDPILAAGVASGTGAASARESSAEDGVAYVSLPPGAVPTGSRVSIRRVGDPAFVTTAVLDGGFDPVAVAATAGDAIEVRVTDAGGGTVLLQVVAVRAARPPVVVRTQPPRRKTDVPLNSAIIVYFSEPVDNATVTPTTVRLERGTTRVSGTVRFLDPTHLSVEFVPTSPLAAGTEYQLTVTAEVRDLSGHALAASVIVPFTTGASLVGPAGSIQLSPDSVLNFLTGLTYDITATVRDAGGNVLTGQTLTWTSSDPAVATVVRADSSAMTRGRVTAVSPGSVTITVTSGTLSGAAFVTVTAPVPNGVASVTFSPDSLTLPALDGRTVVVTLRDANGKELLAGAVPGGHLEVTLSSSNQDVLRSGGTITSDYCGWGTGIFYCPGWNHLWIQPHAEGSAMLIATSEGVSDTAVITVGPRRAVTSVRLAPSYWTMTALGTVTLRAHLLDADGREITWVDGGKRPITWTVDRPAVASVDTIPGSCIDRNGGLQPWAPGQVGVITYACAALVSALDTGSVTVTASSEGASDSTHIAVPHLAFASVSAGGYVETWGPSSLEGHTCGVTVAGVTVCWGGDAGAVGDEWTHFSPVPWTFARGLALTSVSAGTGHSCGLTTTDEAYCWGSNVYLDRWYDYYWGLGSTDDPWQVPGGHRFIALDAGAQRTCGLTTAGVVYCWDYYPSDAIAVSAPLSFTSLSVGSAHACALTADGTAYCWGSNSNGQLGDGSSSPSPVPIAVTGGLTFLALSAGAAHTCGVAADGAVYCWGSNVSGQLGDGSTNDRSVPTSLAGGLSFIALSAGDAASTTCGLTAARTAHCWGDNQWGQLGDGTTANRTTPTPVIGGLPFSSISTGDRHTCAVTTAAVAYCWGWNGAGQLGNGTLSNSYVPVKVAGQP